MRQSTSAARPPAQYVVTPGTQFRLVANEYDKNTYAQCNYASYRTLVRCREIRSKEALAKNGGRCEEHGELSKVFEANHKKEVQRCVAENDSKMQRRRFDPWIASNDYISDEDDFLQTVSSLPAELPDAMSDNLLEDHPLRHAGYFTDKDLVRIKMDLVQKDIDSLVEFKQLLTNQAQKDFEAMKNNTNGGPTDMPQKRAHNASSKYSRSDYLTLTTVDPVFNQCCVGPNMEDSLVVSHIVQSLLDKLDNFIPISVDKQCEKPTLHLSKFCIDHITLDPRQKLFQMCSTCGLTAIGGSDPSCTFHIKNRAITATVSCRCHRCVPNDRTSKERSLTRCEINSDDEEDTKLANLSRIESMVSPMQQFGPPPPSAKLMSSGPPVQSRRYQGTPAQVLRPPQMGPPGFSNFSKTAAQRVVANMRDFPNGPAQQARQRFDAEQQALKMAEEEARTMTCARVRPADPSQFGNGKKRLQQSKQVNPPVAPSPYQFNQQKRTMPSILSGPSTSSPIRTGGSFAGWRNTPANPRVMHQQHQMPSTRFPIHHQQQHQPKTIPLERVQEPKTADELVEDRSSSPLPAYPVPEPPRRGVPYYKNASAYRRTEIPMRPGQHPLMPSSPASGQSPSYPQLLSPPTQQQGQRFRPPVPRPMPPHRAIAAGLNPADAVNPSTPRPSFRAPPPHLQQLPSQQQQLQQPQPQIYQSPQKQRHPSPMITMTMTPNHQQYRQMPRMLSVGGIPGTSPNKVTKSYTVVGSAPRAQSSSSSSPSSSLSSRQPVPPRYTNSALDTARNDARFANMNVKTFLSMGNKDLATMTQEEIDLLAASSQDTPQKRKSQVSMSHGPSSTIQSPTTSPRAEQTPVQLPIPQESPLVPIEVTPQVPVDPVVPGATVAPVAETETPAANRTTKKRKIEETVDPLISSTAADSTGEPVAKKTFGRRGSIGSIEKEKPESQSRAKTPKTPIKRTTPTSSESSGRTPRAAAIAANQAIVHHKPVSSSSTASTSSAPSSQDDGSTSKVENPLDLLAELSEAVAAEEQQNLEAPTKGNKKTPKKASPKNAATT